MSPYVSFMLFLLAILGFIGAALGLNALLGPKPKPNALKQEPFECGATPLQPENVRRIPVKYYGLAIVFLLFDLEGVFLYLWAIGAQPLTGFMVATFGLFVAVLALILAYVWHERVIEDVTG